MLFGVIGGSLGWGLSIIMRIELSLPGFIICSSFSYNSCITFHGILMISFMIMPLLIGGFGNLLIPFLIGISDLIFPRLNAFSLWLVLDSILLIFLSSFIDGGVNAGWTFYVPLSSINYYSIDMLFFSLHIIGLSSLLGSINFICSIYIIYSVNFQFLYTCLFSMSQHNIFSHFHFHVFSFSSYLNLPLFIWSIIITSLLLIISVPVLAACITMVSFDRYMNGCFLDIIRGGDVLLFQHLFWFFGHPEAYIPILPGFGLISEIISKLDQCILFGYDSMILSLYIISMLGCIVWGHHMYIVGFDVDTRTYFTSSTSIIAIPTSIKILNWWATIVSGSLYLCISVLLVVVFLVCFSFGGITGLILSSSIIDSLVHDGYFVVAHFHYVLSLGAVLSMVVGVCMYVEYYVWYSWRMFNWCMFGGVVLLSNIIFMPLHYYGLLGGSRRYCEYGSMWWVYFVVGWGGVCVSGCWMGIMSVIMSV